MIKSNIGKLAVTSVMCAALLVSTVSVYAQPGNQRPLKLVVPYSAGGTTDALARLLQRQLSEVMQRTVLVENKPGGAGTIGTDFVAKAAPDGNTIIFGNQAPNAIVPATRKTPYDPLKDLRPLTTVAFMPLALTVSAQKGAKSLSDFMLGAQKPNANWNYGSSGTGSFAHLASWEFAHDGKLPMEHIPYKGGSEVVNALLAGDIQGSFITAMEAAPLVDAGKLRFLAVTSPKRMPRLPDVPAVAEEVSGYSAVLWFAMFAPKGTPDEVMTKLRNAVVEAVQRPAFKDYLSAHNAEARTSTSEEVTGLIVSDMKFWGGVVRSANIRID